jgi:hypothetical protein
MRLAVVISLAASAFLRPLPVAAASTLVISEVAPWSSGNSPLMADWFEVTNTGAATVDITGWRMDDDSNLFANSVALNGITSIAPGESVIFIETATPQTTVPAFRNLWFGSHPPAGLQIGSYTGSGVGLSTSGDQVHLFDAAGTLQASVQFGASPSGPSFATFNNTAGLATAATLSTVGVNAAFTAVNDANEIGSPGTTLSKLFISEVAPWSSGNSPLAADWFEVTNTTPAAIDITGWRMDDDSNLFANSVALTGITSIGPGESVIFIETASPSTTATAFRSLWFGANPPAALHIGSYTGSGVGLSTNGDQVHLFDAAGTPQTSVQFGASPTGPVFATFENRAGLDGAITSLSALGSTGAAAASDSNEVGSPGTIGFPTQVAAGPPPSIKINEVESNGGTPADWIELINTGTTTTSLSGLTLLDNDNTHPRYAFPAGSTLAAGALLVVDQAQFGFELDNVDSVRLFAADGTTVIDSFAWTQHSPTTFGRCPDGSGTLISTLAPSKGAPNVCLSSIPAETWPGGPSVTLADAPNVFGTNMSGLVYESSGTSAPGVLWAVQNGPGTLWRLIWDTANQRWTPDPAGWATGKPLRYTDGLPDPDSEGVTMTEAGPAAGVYVSTERNNNNNSVSRPTVLRYDVTGTTPTLTATQEWNLTSDLPVLGPNLGAEGVTWLPDTFLVAHNFFDEARGHTYTPADYPTHGTGLFFVGIEGNGLIYAYALHADSSFNRIATIVTGFPAVMDLQFDSDRGDFWAVCDNTCQGRTELLTINASTGRFGIAHLYERPAGMANFNNEGFTPASDLECVNGLKPAFWADDDNDGPTDTDRHALRAGTAPCNFTGPTPHSVRFDGSTGFAEAASSPDLNISGDWTVEAWFKDEDPNGFNHAYRQILSKGDGSANPEAPYSIMIGQNNIVAGMRIAGQDYAITEDLVHPRVDPNAWHHVAVTFNASKNVLNLFLDGKRAGRQEVPRRTATGNTLPLEIGRGGPATGRYWLGKLDEIRIWNVARKSTEIARTYRSQVSGPQPGLVASWHFDQTGGTAAVDSSGNGHSAVLSSGASFVIDVHP